MVDLTKFKWVRTNAALLYYEEEHVASVFYDRDLYNKQLGLASTCYRIRFKLPCTNEQFFADRTVAKKAALETVYTYL